MSREPKPDLLDHVIQKDIVRTLVIVTSARFSELKPKKVESNLFMYHLNQLIKRGIVIKDDGQYALSTEGQMFVDRANLDKLFFRVQPKIITTLAVKSGKGNWLLLERLHEPHMNRIGFPSGKLHYGEHLDDAARRELEEKTGLTDVDLNLAGNVIMRPIDKISQRVVNHTIGYVFTTTLKDEPTVKSNKSYWRSFWGNEEQLLEGNVFKGHPKILHLLKKQDKFIESLDYESDY